MQQQLEMQIDLKMEKAAEVSPCGVYRYWLRRVWGGRGTKILHWIMLNPSTADQEDDDPTIRKCIGFAVRNGYGGITVMNLFAYRATDPQELVVMARDKTRLPKGAGPYHLIGPRNREHLVNMIHTCRDERLPIVAAWGAHGAIQGQDRELGRMAWVAGFDNFLCLGRTMRSVQGAAGMPRHPLMIGYGRGFERFQFER